MAVSMGRGTLLGLGFIRVEADTAPAEKSLGVLGKAAVIGAAGLATLAVATGVMASHFNNDMLKIQTQAGGTAKDVKVLSGAVLTMKNAQQGPDQLAESLYHLKSIGLDNADAMKDLRSASDLASVGSANLEATTNALGGAWRSGIKGAETFAKSAATVNAIIGAGNMRMEDFVAAIGTGILPAARTFGVSLSSIGSALALMTDEGIPATDAATRLKMSLSLLAAPSKVASKQLALIHLTGLQLANMMRSPAGLVGAIGLLKQHLDASGLSLSEQAILLSHAFGGGRSSSAILTMINNYDVLVKKQDQINNSLGKFPAAVAAQRATVSAQFKILQTTVEQVGIRIGEVLIPPMTKFVSFINATGIPAVASFAGAVARMIPEDLIKKSLTSAQADFGTFIDGVTGKAASGKVKAAIMAPWTDALKAVSTGPGAALAKQLLGSQAPKGAGNTSGRSAGPGSALAKQLLAQQTPRSIYAATSPGPQSARAGQSLIGQVPGAKYTPAIVSKPPDAGPWQKAGKEISTVISDLVKFTGQLAKSIGNLVTAAAPVAASLGGPLLGALVLVAHILSSVVGPALEGFTGFLEKHQGTVKFFADVVLGALIAKMIILGSLKAATAITNVGTAILKFPTSSVSSIGTAFTGLKKAGTDFGTAASGIGTKVKGLGSAIAGLSSKAWTGAVTGMKNFGTAAKDAGQNTVQMSIYAKRAVVASAKNAWSGAVQGMKDMAAATKLAAVATLDYTKKQATALATTLSEAAANVWDKTTKLADAAATKIVAAVTWLWDAAMAADPLVLIIAGLVLLVGAIVYVATKTTWFQTAWKATWNFITGLWDTVYRFLTHGFGQFAILITGPLAPLIFLALHWKETWKVIQDAASAAYDFLDKWVIHPIAASFTWLWDKGIAPAVRFIVLSFTTMVGEILKGAVTMLGWVPGIGGKLKAAEKAFDHFAASVNASLGGIKPKTVPVTVSFDGVPEGKITGHSYTSTTGFSYAGGGLVRGAGTGTSDSILAAGPGGLIRVSDREFIVNADSTRRFLPLLRAINSGDPKVYAKGGMIDFSNAAAADMGLASQSEIQRGVTKIASGYARAYNKSNPTRGLAWARTQVGMPYQWGGDGNPSWDCSGFMSAIESVMRGQSPHRRWATGAFNGGTAPPGWTLDAKAPFMIGITNAGVGHTAGTLNGTNVEMSTVGARVGGGARGANNSLFPSHYGLTSYDDGGWLPPGAHGVHNGTGRPEAVMTGAQLDRMGTTVIVNFNGPVGSAKELENWLSSALTNLGRQGRLRNLPVGKG
jgi:TP901 family phage tail tape measure protein